MLTSPAVANALLSASLPAPAGVSRPTPKPRPTGFPPQALVRWA